MNIDDNGQYDSYDSYDDSGYSPSSRYQDSYAATQNQSDADDRLKRDLDEILSIIKKVPGYENVVASPIQTAAKPADNKSANKAAIEALSDLRVMIVSGDEAASVLDRISQIEEMLAEKA